MAIIDSVKLPDNSTYEVADNHSGYQKETLTTPLTINGTQETTVEGALSGLNDYGDALADNLAANENVYGAKNILSYPYEETTKTENGVTFTDNGDGTISVVASSGATADTYFGLHYPYKPLYVEKGTYILSGCPAGGSESTYYLSSSYGNDTGDGITVTESSGDNRLFLIIIKSGTVIPTRITFKPMIRDARILDDTFAPYAKTNRELTKALDKAIIYKQYVFTVAGDDLYYKTIYENVAIQGYTFVGLTYTYNSLNYTGLLRAREGSMIYGDIVKADGSIFASNETVTTYSELIFVKNSILEIL